jgi:hypothetical protein
MRRAIRVGIPLAVAATLVSGAAVFVAEPWNDTASGTTVEYRFCDTVLTGPAETTAQPVEGSVLIVRQFTPKYDPATEEYVDEPVIILRVVESVEVVHPDTGQPTKDNSLLALDPKTGVPTLEHYVGASGEASLRSVLATARLAPLDPGTAPWPYTSARQRAVKRIKRAEFGYLPVDPGSGIVVALERGSGPDFFSHTLIVQNCRSTLAVSLKYAGPTPETTVTREIDPADEDAFQRFLDEVDAPGLSEW